LGRHATEAVRSRENTDTSNSKDFNTGYIIESTLHYLTSTAKGKYAGGIKEGTQGRVGDTD
jgi:hypothetical protein